MLNKILELGAGGYEVTIVNDKMSSCVHIIVSKGDESFDYMYRPSADIIVRYRDLVRRILAGEFGNGLARHNALLKAGYDPVLIQTLVNKALDGRVNRITHDDIFMIEAENIIDKMVSEIERLEKNVKQNSGTR